MRASKARAGHRAGKPCHRHWSAYDTSREYSEAPLHTRGGSHSAQSSCIFQNLIADLGYTLNLDKIMNDLSNVATAFIIRQANS
jgi:hypothetical protein